MQFDNQKTRNIADVAAKILAGESEKQEPKMLEEELKGDQHKIDANKNNKIDAHDFKLLRSKKKVEEETEQIDEIKMADLPATKVQGRAYGASKPEPHIIDTLKGPKEKELKAIEAEKKKKKFSEMVNMYQEIGLKSLSQLMVNEEPTQDEFEKEIKTAQDKSEGKIRNDKNIAAGKVDAVKEVEESVDDINGVQIETIEERSLTEPEMKKKEEIVKGMKKGMAGFKQRYGERAKEVMYATATARAKGE